MPILIHPILLSLLAATARHASLLVSTHLLGAHHAGALLAAHTTQTAGSGSILSPIAKPIADILAAIYSIVPDYGVAILVLSVAWMILISPLTLKTTRSMLAMQRLQPQIKQLQDKHKNDRQAFAQAQMDLYKQEGVSPFGSCLPTLLPLPVFFALYRVIDGLSNLNSHGKADPEFLSRHTKMWHDIVASGGHLNAFGLDLSKSALSSHASILAAIPFFVLLLIMMGTQYFQTAQMMSRNPAAKQNPQMKMMKFIPLVFGVICIRFPAGVVLYYAMSNVCRIAQQYAMYRFDPKVKKLAKKDEKDLEALTREIDDKRSRGRRSISSRGPRPGSPSAALATSPQMPSEPETERRGLRKLLQEAAQESAARKQAQQSTPARRGNQSAKAASERSTGQARNQAGGKKPSSQQAAGGAGQVKKQAAQKRAPKPIPASSNPRDGADKTKQAPVQNQQPASQSPPSSDGGPGNTNGSGSGSTTAAGSKSGRTGAGSQRTNRKRRGR